MSNNNENIPPVPPAPPAPPKKKRHPGRVLLSIAVPVVTFVIGAALAASGASTAPAETPEPEAQVKTETVTEEVETTPSSCIDALDSTDELIGYFVEALESAGDSVMYASSFDIDSLDAETQKLEELTPKVETARSEYDAAAIQCRASE